MTGKSWLGAWPDALAFVGGLAVAWFASWNPTDLVWSLWLSSLTVGLAMIVWLIFSRAAWSPALLLFGVAVLAFFVMHFGFFHFVHSQVLGGYFPVGSEGKEVTGEELYVEVVRRYWMFIPMAALAERANFLLPPPELRGAQGFKELLRKDGGGMLAPYKGVVRMHVLIFFFAGAHFLKLDSFLVYAVVYAVYFFPWRLVGKEA